MDTGGGVKVCARVRFTAVSHNGAAWICHMTCQGTEGYKPTSLQVSWSQNMSVTSSFLTPSKEAGEMVSAVVMRLAEGEGEEEEEEEADAMDAEEEEEEKAPAPQLPQPAEVPVATPTQQEVDMVILAKHPEVAPIIDALNDEGKSGASLSSEELNTASMYVTKLRTHYAAQILRIRQEEAAKEVRADCDRVELVC